MSHCLVESTPTRKNKITLSDYNYQKDILNRILMTSFSSEDLRVLEEILYSPIQISLIKLAKNVELSQEYLLTILKKLLPSGLFFFQDESIVVDKESRKYFELHIQRFDKDFEPGMDFLQSLLKKPPIHVLPLWYSTPRASNNIFDSIVEKNLLTPQIFLRYIAELNFGEPILQKIIEDVYTSPTLELPAIFLMQKYKITREIFEEYMLHLEFSFVCCIRYEKSDSTWEERVTPFQEWKDYLQFLNNTEIKTSFDDSLVVKKRPQEFAFVEDLTVLLQTAKTSPIPLVKSYAGPLIPEQPLLFSPSLTLTGAPADAYIHSLLQKAELLSLGTIKNNTFQLAEASTHFLSLRKDEKSLYLYRHPLNKITSVRICPSICTEKAMREAEKSVSRVASKGWVRLDDFIKGVTTTLSEDSTIVLRRFGKQWRYTLPCYSPDELLFLRAIVMEWLFESGLVQTGFLENQEVFCVTTLGKNLFGR